VKSLFSKKLIVIAQVSRDCDVKINDKSIYYMQMQFCELSLCLLNFYEIFRATFPIKERA